MRDRGFDLDPAGPEAQIELMHIEVSAPEGAGEIAAMTASLIAIEKAVALTAMLHVENPDAGLFEAHHTNLDPRHAKAPDPLIVVESMPHFRIATLRWIGLDGSLGRIVH
jgi:hypothetical protein